MKRKSLPFLSFHFWLADVGSGATLAGELKPVRAMHTLGMLLLLLKSQSNRSNLMLLFDRSLGLMARSSC
jgi:hypothetical protein